VLSISTAFGATTAWQVGTSTWFYGPNWNNGEPDPSPNAFINNGGTAQITLDAGQAVALSLTLGLNPDQWGTVEVSAPFGGLTVGQAIIIGYRGKGNLVITDGDSVMSASASIASLTNELLPPSQGSATLNGGGLWTLSGRFDVGGYNNTPGGVALLNVTNGSTVSAGSVRVYNSGTLTGNGTVSTADGMTIDGTLAPSGTLTIDGNLSFGANANTRCNVSSTSVDNAQVSGAAFLNGKLSVTLNGLFTGDFTLLHASTPYDQFSSYSFTYTGCLSPSIRYVNGTDVVLHVESSCQ